MNKHFVALVIFFITSLTYFAVGTGFTFKPKWTLDYFNPLAFSLRNFHLDIPKLGDGYDLVEYKGKWFLPWGVLPALILLPIQIIKGEYIPTLYLSVIFGSLNIMFFYLLLLRLKKEFLERLTYLSILTVTIFYAFGTTHFYIGTLGSVWHVDQIVSTFFANLGIFIVLRKKRKFIHYLFSVIFISITLLGRATLILFLIVPLILYFETVFKNHKTYYPKHLIYLLITPFLFSLLFMLYNIARFGRPLEFGYNYIHESAYLADIRKSKGIFSLKSLPTNVWFMLFETPSFTNDNGIKLLFNLKGNSIFFLSPPLLAAFLACPIAKKRGKWKINVYILTLVAAAVITLIPSLLIYSTGWMQFGYRYSLDVTILLILLGLFGLNGKLNVLYAGGTLFAIIMHVLGIRALW